jgi:hypothetical protein
MRDILPDPARKGGKQRENQDKAMIGGKYKITPGQEALDDTYPAPLVCV